MTSGSELRRPTRSELIDAIATATSRAVRALFREHPTDHFYYCSLVTTGEALAPNLVAWSREALDAAVANYPKDPRARQDLKWSYADSPFYCYGEGYFTEVRRLFDSLGQLDPEDSKGWREGYEFRMSVMQDAMARVEQSGVFGTGDARAKIVVNVEVMPPDHTNVARARALNPPEALTVWLAEAAEPNDGAS